MEPGEEISELYAGALDAFTPGRDALAKRLRQDGDRDAAERVKRLRKPSITAWALNRVRAVAPDQVDALLTAGERLRAAQEGLFAGSGSGSGGSRGSGSGGSGSGSGGSGSQAALRAAAAEERQLVDTLVATGLEQLADAGHAPTPTLQNRLFATLRAVASDDEARAALAAGTLTRDYEIADFGFGLAPDIETPKKKHARTSKPEPEPEIPQRDEQAIARTRAALADAQADRERAQTDLDRAQTDLERAEARTTELTAELDRLEF